ncbi:MAG TPA: heme o synthase [Candidatus Saccharimonadales bacterium]
MDFKARLRRYYILSKPGIVYANIITAIAGYLYASQFDIAVSTLAGLIVGFTSLIAGACAYNNYLDRNIDSHMQRTQKRGLVTGELTARQALAYATIATSGGTLLLAVTQNSLTLLLAVIAFVDYVILYGWTKRTTVHGTLVGTISGSIPLVAGYTSVTGRLDLEAWLLLILMTAWQMAHFYAIALYRLKDYKAAHIPVMPAVYGAAVTKPQTIVYILVFIGAAVSLVLFGQLGLVAGAVLAGAGGWWLVKALKNYRTAASDAWGRTVFLSSLTVMIGMSFCLAIGPVLPVFR